MSTETPLLVTRRLLDAYSYLSLNTTILRPSSLRDIPALKALRTGLWQGAADSAMDWGHEAERSYDGGEAWEGALFDGEEGEGWEGARGAGDLKRELEREVREMIERGWKVSEEVWREWKRGVYDGNAWIGRRILGLA
jgi:hypothetical protein